MELQFKVTQLAMARVETRTHFQDLILGRMTGNPSGCPLFPVIQQESQSFINGLQPLRDIFQTLVIRYGHGASLWPLR